MSANFSTLYAPGVLIATIAHTSGDLLDHLDDTKGGTDVLKKLHKLHCDLMKPLNGGMSALVCVCALLGATKGGLEGTAVIKEAQQALKADSICTEASTEELFQQRAVLNELALGAANRIVFVTDKQQVGVTYHPDSLGGITSGDLIVGLFGINLPVILRSNAHDA